MRVLFMLTTAELMSNAGERDTVHRFVQVMDHILDVRRNVRYLHLLGYRVAPRREHHSSVCLCRRWLALIRSSFKSLSELAGNRSFHRLRMVLAGLGAMTSSCLYLLLLLFCHTTDASNTSTCMLTSVLSVLTCSPCPSH